MQPTALDGIGAQLITTSEKATPCPLYRALAPIFLNHGRRNVFELFSREGDEVAEEVWWMWVSDYHSFSGVPDRGSSVTF